MSDTANKAEMREVVSKVVAEVFDSMMSMEIEALDPDLPVSIEGDRVVGSVGFGGEEAGVVCLHVNEPFSRQMTAAMIGVELNEVNGDTDVNDAIGELTNMISGNIKSQLYDMVSSSALAVPSIMRGSHVAVESIRAAHREHFVFRHKGQFILLELYLKSK